MRKLKVLFKVKIKEFVNHESFFLNNYEKNLQKNQFKNLKK